MTKPKYKVWDKVVYYWLEIYMIIYSIKVYENRYWEVEYRYNTWTSEHFTEESLRKPTQEELDLYYN